MKRTITKASIVMGVLLIAGTFTSCNKKKKVQEIASNDIVVTTKEIEKKVEKKRSIFKVFCSWL